MTYSIPQENSSTQVTETEIVSTPPSQTINQTTNQLSLNLNNKFLLYGSFILYSLSCMLPFDVSNSGYISKGAGFLVFGIFLFLFEGAFFALANPLWLIGLIFAYYKKHLVSLMFSSLALITGLEALIDTEIGFLTKTNNEILTYHIGLCAWYLSFLLLFLYSFFELLLKVLLKKPEEPALAK